MCSLFSLPVRLSVLVNIRTCGLDPLSHLTTVAGVFTFFVFFLRVAPSAHLHQCKCALFCDKHTHTSIINLIGHAKHKILLRARVWRVIAESQRRIEKQRKVMKELLASKW